MYYIQDFTRFREQEIVQMAIPNTKKIRDYTIPAMYRNEISFGIRHVTVRGDKEYVSHDMVKITH